MQPNARLSVVPTVSEPVALEEPDDSDSDSEVPVWKVGSDADVPICAYQALGIRSVGRWGAYSQCWKATYSGGWFWCPITPTTQCRTSQLRLMVLDRIQTIWPCDL